MGLRIIADEQVSAAREAFCAFGELEVLPPGAITPERVKEADVLLVRSTVRVDAALLRGSRCRFVGTATSGTDHVDTSFLAARGITFAAAPGSNADSVLEWFVGALVHACLLHGLDTRSVQIGVVGVGAVGSRVARFCRALGTTPLLCDPPRARAEGQRGFVDLDELMRHADVVTLHVPLVDSAIDGTRHLIDRGRLARLRPDRRGLLLVNAARGDVLEGPAVLEALGDGTLGGVLIDTWPGEPSPDPRLVEAAEVATAHIAGHSLEGRLRGTEALHRALAAFVGSAPSWSSATALASMAPRPPICPDVNGRSDEELLRDVLARAAGRSLLEDDSALRHIAALPPPHRAEAFARFRRSYPVKREVAGCEIRLSATRPRLDGLLTLLGAKVSVTPAPETI